MSRWTHVCGLVRIDGLPFGQPWESDLVTRLRTGAPYGSEGPIQWEIRPSNSNSSGISLGYVALWADLRDFGTAENIGQVEAWLTSVFRAGEGWCAREGIVSIEDEHEKNSVIWRAAAGVPA